MRWPVALALVGCSTQRTYVVNASEVQAHLGELVTTGEAKVETYRTWTEDNQPMFTRLREVIRLDQDVKVDAKPTKLADLTLHCEHADPQLGKDSPCALVRMSDKFLELRTDEKSNLGETGKIILAVSIAGVALGAAACTFGCDSPYNYVSAGVVVAAVIGALAMCSSSPGCHD